MNFLKILFLILFLGIGQSNFASVHIVIPNSILLKNVQSNPMTKHWKTQKIDTPKSLNRPEKIKKKPKNKWRIFTILMIPSLALTVIAAALPYLPALILFYIAGILFVIALLILLAMSIPPIKIKRKNPKKTQ